MKRIYDGTVIPSAQNMKMKQLPDGYHSLPKFSSLMIGSIVDVSYVDDQKNGSSSDSDTTTAFDTTYTVRVDMLGGYPYYFYGCRAVSGVFGINNHCEIRHEACSDASNYSATDVPYALPNTVTGSRCVIGLLDGQMENAVILGFLRHPSTKSKKVKGDKLDFDFSFNGLGVQIDKDGQVTLKSLDPPDPPEQTTGGNMLSGLNTSSLSLGSNISPLEIVISPDHEVTITDDEDQVVRVSRIDKVIEFTNGNETITINKSSEKIEVTAGDTISVTSKNQKFEADDSFSVTSKTTEISADDSINGSAKDVIFKADKAATLQGNKIAIGSSSTELLDLLYQIFDAMSKITVATPCGPAGPIMGAPQWAQVLQLLIKLKSITGSI